MLNLRFQLWALIALVGAIAPRSILACICAGSSSVCNAFSQPGPIFVGKVEATDPPFDPWDPEFSKRFKELFPGRDLDSLDGDDSFETLAKLKDFYSAIVSKPYRDRVTKATTRKELEAVLEEITDAGVRVTLKVLGVYRGISAQPTSIDVRTDFSDCGIRFIKGEVYLVYAFLGKKGLEARACSRTRRLSDAGEDLVYLDLMRSGAEDTGRIYGFVSSNELDVRTPHVWDSVSSPVSGLGVRAHFGDRTLMADTNREGRFVFDGLPASDFEVTVTDWQGEKALSETLRVHLEKRECKGEWLYVPKGALPK